MVGALLFLYGCGPQTFVIRQVPGRQELAETRVYKDAGLFVRDKIALIDVDGLMANNRKQAMLGSGENPVSLFQEKLDHAARDKRVKAVVLRLNSAGGTVSASDMMYTSLGDFKKTTGKPVVACMLGVAASGAYYLACGSDGIVAQPSSITGSIGTIMQTMSFAGTLKKLGIKTEAIKSQELKDLGSPLHDLRPEEREILQEIIRHFYEQFLEVVLAGRKNLTREELLKLADGRVFTAQQAKDAGLIDHIGYLKDAIAAAKRLAGVTTAKVVLYHRPIGYKANIYAGGMPNVAVPALINIELPQWLQAEGPQFLYLWQPGNMGQ